MSVLLFVFSQLRRALVSHFEVRQNRFINNLFNKALRKGEVQTLHFFFLAYFKNCNV